MGGKGGWRLRGSGGKGEWRLRDELLKHELLRGKSIINVDFFSKF